MKVTCVRVDEPFVARCYGILWWGVIETGTLYDRLPEQVRLAVHFHELGHLVSNHMLKRIWCLFTTPHRIYDLCHAQEFEADAYAADFGLAKGLKYIFKKGFKGSKTHPSHLQRLHHLELYEQSRSAPVKGHIRQIDVIGH